MYEISRINFNSVESRDKAKFDQEIRNIWTNWVEQQKITLFFLGRDRQNKPNNRILAENFDQVNNPPPQLVKSGKVQLVAVLLLLSFCLLDVGRGGGGGGGCFMVYGPILI